MAEVEVIKAVEGPILRKRDYEGKPLVITRQKVAAYVRVSTDDEEQLEIMAYSPEIGTELKIICFPTFPGHCGCMLFPLDEIHYVQKQDEVSQIWKDYLLKQE